MSDPTPHPPMIQRIGAEAPTGPPETSLYSNDTHGMKPAKAPPRPVGLPCAVPALAERLPGSESAEAQNSGAQSRLRVYRRRPPDDQQKMLEVTRYITRIQEPQELFQTLVDKAAELTGAERGYLLLRTNARGSTILEGLKLMASRKLPSSMLEKQEFRASRSAILEAIHTGQTVYLEANGGLNQPSQSVAHHGVNAVLVEPITLHGHVLGVIYLDAENKIRFQRDHVEMLPSFAAQAAICLENLRLIAEREAAIRKQLADQAEALKFQVYKETMSSFLRVASHDLKSPLTVLKTGLAVLKREPEQPVRDTVFADMEEAVERANRLISNYLDFEKLDSGRSLDLKKREIRFRSVVEEEIRLLRSRMNSEQAAKFRFQVAIPEEETVWADPDRLSQIIGNILGNSVKFSPLGGDIMVHHSVSQDHDIISFSDRGMGMSAPGLKKATEPFSQINPEEGGSGLGLHIVRQLVEAHQGAMDIESHPGNGTIVWVALPRGPVTKAG